MSKDRHLQKCICVVIFEHRSAPSQAGFTVVLLPENLVPPLEQTAPDFALSLRSQA